MDWIEYRMRNWDIMESRLAVWFDGIGIYWDIFKKIICIEFGFMSDYPTVLFQRFDEINSWSDSGWKISLGFNKIAVKFILYRSVECSPHPRKKKTFCWTCCRYFDQTLAFYILLLSLRFNSEASIWHWDSKLKKVFQKKKFILDVIVTLGRKIFPFWYDVVFVQDFEDVKAFAVIVP